MTKTQKTRVRLAALALGLAGLLVPAALSPGDAIEANDACAAGSCCREVGSVCEVGEETQMHYYPADACKPIDW